MKSDTSYIQLAIDVRKCALECLDEYNYSGARQICYQRIGSAYSDLGEPRTAIEFCMKALDIMENDKENEWELLCFLTFAEAYDNIKDYEKAIHYYKKAGIKIEDCRNDPRETRELVVQCPYLTFLNVHHLERQGAYIQTKVEELEQLNQSIRDRDKMKDDAIAHLSDQLIDLTTRLDSIERRQR